MSKKKSRAVPPWDDFFMAMAFCVATRSKDPIAQNGAVVVSHSHCVLGVGWNGPPKGVLDQDIDWTRRGMISVPAEENALDHVLAAPAALEGATVYVTGPPASASVKRLISRGIKKIVYGPQNLASVSEDDWLITKEWVKLTRITLERYTGNLNWLRDRMEWMENSTPEVFQPQIPLPL